MRHGAFLIPPHGLRRVWRVEYYDRGKYLGRHNYAKQRHARAEQNLYNTITKVGNQ